MATKKTTKKTATKSTTKSSTQTEPKQSRVSDHFRFGESYTSLILGIVVVIIASILLISFVRNRGDIDILQTDTPDISSTNIGPNEDNSDESRYTVEEGDDLWSIAEKNYDSGYNWVDIQEANNIDNPNAIAAGTELIIPDVDPKSPTVDTQTQSDVSDTATQISEAGDQITGSEHTIAEGDTLWNIAVRRYDDGYQWVKIAEANNLPNPNRILVGNTLKLP